MAALFTLATPNQAVIKHLHHHYGQTQLGSKMFCLPSFLRSKLCTQYCGLQFLAVRKQLFAAELTLLWSSAIFVQAFPEQWKETISQRVMRRIILCSELKIPYTTIVVLEVHSVKPFINVYLNFRPSLQKCKKVICFKLSLKLQNKLSSL